MDKKWQQVREIFDSALRRKPEERPAFVVDACGNDKTLLKEVESLLSSLDSAQSFLETAAVTDIAGALAPTLELKNGRSFAHYEIIRQIGEGGMGVVYLGRDTRLDRFVAIKLLNNRYERHEDNIRRFVREAKAASALNHPNILTIFEIGEYEDSHYIVSEYIEGRTLREILKGETMELKTIVDMTAQIANALAAAHKTRIVHRDIKPENIIVRDDGYVKVLDFGLAKLLPENASGVFDKGMVQTQNSTASGMILGTVNYMSPEQARALSIDQRTDIFSLGVVLYEMITGIAPFKADTSADTIAAIIQCKPLPPGRTRNDVPEELDNIVAKMIEKDRDARYQSAEVLSTDLKQLQRRLEFEAELEGTSQPDRQMEAATELFNRTRAKRKSRSEPSNSIAVLPFVNMSGDPENEYFCDGLAEELLNALAKIEDLKVAARTSTFTFKNRNIEISEIGRALNVRTVLEGSVRKSGNKLRVTVQLVSARDGFHLWSEKYDRDMKDIFDIQDEITLAVVDALKVKLLGKEKVAILKRYSDDAEAYELYLKGLYHSYKWTDASFLTSLEYFKKCLEKDPGFAPAYAKIADYYHFHSFVGGISPNEVIGKRREAAQRALELDESLPEAHLAMANIHFYHDRNWAKAEHEFQRAIRFNPNDPKSHMLYGLFLVSRERFDEAVAEGKKALTLDPLSVAVNFVAAQTNFYADRFEDALALVWMIRELDANAPQSFWQEGKLLLANGRYEEAVDVLQHASALGDNQMALSMRGCAYGLAGRRDEARSILDQLFELRERSYAAAFNIARVYAGLGDRDKAFEWLEKAIDERNAELVHLKRKVEAGKKLYFGDGFSSDPRYLEILRRAGLPHESGSLTKSHGRQISRISSSRDGQETVQTALQTNEQLNNTSFERPNLKWWPFGLLAVIVLAGLYFGYHYVAPAGKQIESIAVMPFVNETGDPQVEYLSDGMTETLISSLSELPNIKVKARTSVFRYKGKEIDPKAIGRELGVQAIVNGRVTQRDGRTNVLLEMVDTETEDVIFSTKYDKPQSALVTLQSDIARDVSGKLKSKLSGADEAKVTKTHTADPEALQLYLQGQFYRHKGGRNNVLRATDYFNKAIEKDPNYALAYAGLALNYYSYDLYNLVPDWQKANAAAKRALELDDSLAEANLAAGHFRRAIELNPDYADAHVGLCINLTMTKRFDEGITECSKAHELDPSSAVVTTHLGAAYFFARRPDESIEMLTLAHKMDPTLWVPLGYLGGAQTLKGQYTEAAATFRKAIEISDGSPNAKSHLAYALAKAGQRDEAMAMINELKRLAEREHINTFHFAVPYIGLGDKDEAFFWLGKGIDEGSIGFKQLDVHPWFDDLRSDPRFTALLQRARSRKS
ncbi:MAG TPA: protein kinase [Pyrinomonadaceae bacterium]